MPVLAGDERRRLIDAYQEATESRLILLIDVFQSMTPWVLRQVLGAEPRVERLHVLLASLGGYSSAAFECVRIVREGCKELTVIIPGWAKSCAPLFALGADRLIFGPTGELGPVDFMDVSNPLAPSVAIGDPTPNLRRALAFCPSRGSGEMERLVDALRPSLVGVSDHGTRFGYADAVAAGLPAARLDTSTAAGRVLDELWQGLGPFLLDPPVEVGIPMLRLLQDSQRAYEATIQPGPCTGKVEWPASFSQPLEHVFP